jgi:hypothetical protein
MRRYSTDCCHPGDSAKRNVVAVGSSNSTGRSWDGDLILLRRLYDCLRRTTALAGDLRELRREGKMQQSVLGLVQQ